MPIYKVTIEAPAINEEVVTSVASPWPVVGELVAAVVVVESAPPPATPFVDQGPANHCGAAH
jgi:hypothetical protein